MNEKEAKKTIIYMILHFTLLLLLLISFGSCTMPIKRVVVEEKIPDNTTRSTKYLECISRLSKEGIKQTLIKDLCNNAYGSIE